MLPFKLDSRFFGFSLQKDVALSELLIIALQVLDQREGALIVSDGLPSDVTF